MEANGGQHQFLLENVIDIVAVVNDRLRLTYVNPAVTATLGWPIEEIVGLSALHLVHPDDQLAAGMLLQRGLDEPDFAARLELRLRHRDGDWRPMEGVGRSVQVRGGDSEVVVTLRDVSERRATDALMRLQATALRAAANGIVITEADGTVVWVNPAFSTMTGYSAAEILRATPRVLKSGRHSEEFYRAMWGAIKRGQTWTGELLNSSSRRRTSWWPIPPGRGRSTSMSTCRRFCRWSAETAVR